MILTYLNFPTMKLYHLREAKRLIEGMEECRHKKSFILALAAALSLFGVMSLDGVVEPIEFDVDEDRWVRIYFVRLTRPTCYLDLYNTSPPFAFNNHEERLVVRYDGREIEEIIRINYDE